MNRNLSFSALVLKNSRSGESNREAWLLTREAGLLRATVFGGPKSHLRAYASPFHSGQAWVYHEPVKDTYKLSDFDVHAWRPGLRELFERAMAADAVARAILLSHGGGGDSGKAFSLAEETLEALHNADKAACLSITLWFFWQWVGFLGITPDINCCITCGNPMPKSSVSCYLQLQNGLVCNKCAACKSPEMNEAIIKVGPGARHWLNTVQALSASQLSHYTMDRQTLNETRSFLSAILTEALGKACPPDWSNF